MRRGWGRGKDQSEDKYQLKSNITMEDLFFLFPSLYPWKVTLDVSMGVYV